MANIQERRDKSGKLISYSIRVHRGRAADGKQLKPYTATFDVLPTWTEKSARKKAEAFAATFERDCLEGIKSDSRQRFDAYCDYVIELKEQQRVIKHSTSVRYKELSTRIYPAIGHIKLKDLRADHLNALYLQLGKEGVKKSGGRAAAKIDLAAALKEKRIKRAHIAERSGVSASAISAAVRGVPVSTKTAQAVADALGVKLEEAFTVLADGGKLAPKTIVEYHRLISTVLEQAVKEGLVPFNVAARAMPPKIEQKPVNYFQPETVAAIRDALDTEPMKWKVLTHLLLITGARRGEIVGLKWSMVDFNRSRIHICNNLLYAVDIGIYEDTAKTEQSERYVSLPSETMQLLKQYRTWQAEERLRLGEYYHDQGYLFTRDNGSPLHPDSVTSWLDKFSRRHGLPHVNPHAFRHTMASILIHNKQDIVSISKRLGHAKTSTTTDIYSHIIKEADEQSAEILSEIFLRKA